MVSRSGNWLEYQSAYMLSPVNREVLERCEDGRIRILQCYLASSLLPSTFLHISPYVLLPSSGWDIHDTVYSKELLISNKANGYRDVIAIIDLSSFRRIPWENNVPFFLVSFLDPVSKLPLSVDPRGVLKIATERIASTLGYECFAGVEYEVRQVTLLSMNLSTDEALSISISKVN